MDLTGGVIAVIQITGALFKICSEYYSQVKSAREDIKRIRNEALCIHDILANIRDMAYSQDGQDLAVVKSLCVSDGPLQTCERDCHEIYRKLEYAETKEDPKGAMTKYGLRALKWPFKSKDADKIMETLRRYEYIFQLAISRDLTILTKSVGKGVEELKVVLAETQAQVAAIHEKSLSDADTAARDELFRWLNAPDTTSAHQKASELHQPSTGEWFLKGAAFQEWKTTPDKPLWLHGIPGCGKTVLSAAIIDNVRHKCYHRPDQLCAYFYFDFSDARRQQSRDFLVSIIKQLCMQSDSLLKTLIERRKRSTVRDQPPNRLTLASLLELCAKNEQSKDIYIIVDALDECPLGPQQHDRDELRDVLDFIHSWKLSKIHMLVSSRIEPDIEQLFSDIGEVIKVRFRNEDVDADIRKHVTHRLGVDPKLRRWNKIIKSEIEEALVRGAKGMFRWVYCHLEALRTCINANEVKAELYSLPATLDETYERIILNIKDQHRKYAQRALLWLSFSMRPLSMHEIAEAATLDPYIGLDLGERFPEPSSLLELLGSLVTVMSVAQTDKLKESGLIFLEDKVDCIQLAHFTVKEYVLSEQIKIRSLRDFYITPVSSHTFMALGCLKYMTYVAHCEERKAKDSSLMDIYPLFFYSYFNLAHHVKELPSPRSQELEEVLVEFFISGTTISMVAPAASEAGALWFAVRNGMKSLVEELIRRGVDLDEVVENNVGESIEWDIHPALCVAVGLNDQSMVQLLLEKGASPNAICSDENPVLVKAYEEQLGHRDLQIVRLLLEHGADTNCRREDGEPLFHEVIQTPYQTGISPLIQLFLDHNADPNLAWDDGSGYERTPLHIVKLKPESKDRDNLINLLLQSGAENRPEPWELDDEEYLATEDSEHESTQPILS